jgi:diguanylate cyclase (GGDEF)-like protein
LLVIFLSISRQKNQHLQDQKLFRIVLYINALILALDIFMWLLDGRPGLFMRNLNLLITAAYYILNPLISLLWLLFIDFFIYKSESHSKKILIPLLIPFGINMLLSILSIFNNLYFYIDGANVYHRGSLFYLMVAISFFYLVYAFVLIIKKHKIIPKRDFLPLLSFAIPPSIGAVIQAFVFGFSIVWPCVTISILIVYINIQNEQLYKDYLTGLFNRRQLDNYLQYALQNFGDDLLAGIMIDLNAFKMINDIYGHATGDEALQYTANILKKSFRKNDFIARYGGDEFIVLAVFREKIDLFRAIDRLKENVEKFNRQHLVQYTISLSMGYDFYSSRSKETFTEFLKHLDDLMYQDKMMQPDL